MSSFCFFFAKLQNFNSAFVMNSITYRFLLKIARYYLDGKEDRSVGESAGTLRPDQS